MFKSTRLMVTVAAVSLLAACGGGGGGGAAKTAAAIQKTYVASATAGEVYPTTIMKSEFANDR